MPSLKFAINSPFDGVGFGVVGALAIGGSVTPESDTHESFTYNRALYPPYEATFANAALTATFISVSHADLDLSAPPDAFIVPVGHNLDGEALSVRQSSIAGGTGAWTEVDGWTQSGSGIIVREFTTAAAEVYYFTIDTSGGAVEADLPELMFTNIIEMARPPSRPGGAEEDIFNVKNEQTSGGHDRFLEYGDAKKQRTYDFPNIGEADKDLLLTLWESWAGKNPFFMRDHNGVWILVKFTESLSMEEIAYQRYKCKVAVVEVF